MSHLDEVAGEDAEAGISDKCLLSREMRAERISFSCFNACCRCWSSWIVLLSVSTLRSVYERIIGSPTLLQSIQNHLQLFTSLNTLCLSMIYHQQYHTISRFTFRSANSRSRIPLTCFFRFRSSLPVTTRSDSFKMEGRCRFVRSRRSIRHNIFQISPLSRRNWTSNC